MALSDFYPQMKGWTAAPTEAQSPDPGLNTPGPSQTYTSDRPSPYIRTNLPLPLQYTPDTLKQYNRPGLSAFRTAPLPPGGNPAVNAASSSVVTSNISEFVVTAAAGPNGAVQFNNGGSLGGVTQFEWLNGSSTLAITGTIQLTGTANATVFNASTGFQIGGAAASGQYLRGNGTDFVSAILSASDIAAGVLGITFGGTGTSTPGLVAGNDITITGSWPDNTIAVKVQSGVTAGSYTNTNLTVDAQGIITAIANGTSGSGWNTVSKNSNYTAVANDMVLADTSGGGFTVTLPVSASNINKSIRVKKISSDANALVIARSSADHIDGQTSQTITGQYTNIEMIADGGTNWWIA